MAALTRPRNVARLGDQAVLDYLDVPLKANAKVYLGALVVLNAGYGQQGSTATGLIAAGIAAPDPVVPLVDNTGGADGALVIRVAQGVFPFDNSTAGDQIAQTDAGKICYVVDDHTVAKTDGGTTRSQAGVIIGLDPAGRVFVSVGTQLQPPGAATGGGGGGGGGTGETLKAGTNLTDADATINPAAARASEYTLPAAVTLTAGRTVTLGTTGTPVTNSIVRIVRRSLGGNTLTIVNGGGGGGTLLVFGASPSSPEAADFFYDGTNWSLLTFSYWTT
jgi:hypothetical protein